MPNRQDLRNRNPAYSFGAGPACKPIRAPKWNALPALAALTLILLSLGATRILWSLL